MEKLDKHAGTKKETFLTARRRLFSGLEFRGGKASKAELKRPYIDTEWGRVEFHAQAVYLDGHSLFIDIRGMTVDDLVKHVSRRYNKQDDV